MEFNAGMPNPDPRTVELNGGRLTISQVEQRGSSIKFQYQITRGGQVLMRGTFWAVAGFGRSIEDSFHQDANRLMKMLQTYVG